MKQKNKNLESNNPKKGWLFWTPRIISIIFLMFLALFSLDTFGNGYSFWETILGLFMHNIPVFILAIILWLSWNKREWIAGSIFILAGLLYVYLSIFRAEIPWYIGLSWSLTIAGPAFLVGILFFMNWKRKRN
jgi:Na+/proline symporter